MIVHVAFYGPGGLMASVDTNYPPQVGDVIASLPYVNPGKVWKVEARQWMFGDRTDRLHPFLLDVILSESVGIHPAGDEPAP